MEAVSIDRRCGHPGEGTRGLAEERSGRGSASTLRWITSASPTSPVDTGSSPRAWVGASMGTLCSSLPAFLTGALAVQIRDDLDFSISLVGVMLGSAFAVAGICSAPMGRLAQMLGPGRALRLGLSGSGLVMVAIAGWATSSWHFLVLMALSGVANALNQPAANLLLSSRIRPEQLGLALAVKQSGMPAAALLGGLAVPALALTAGWRWAYVAAALLAFAAVLLQPIGLLDQVGMQTARSTAPRPDMPLGLLMLYGAVGFLGATNAGAMVNLLTSAATDSGVGEGMAGWLLSVGSGTGILSRLYHGWMVDARGVLPIQRLIWLLGIGSVGVFVMAIDEPITYFLAVIPAFAAGWAWPGLFNLSVIRNNPSAPASATGISQIGIFVGAGFGPVIGGLLVDWGGYRPLWVMCAILLAIGSVLAMYLRSRIADGGR